MPVYHYPHENPRLLLADEKGDPSWIKPERSGKPSRANPSFSYEVEGSNYFDIERHPFAADEDLVLFADGKEIAVSTENEPIRFLLMAGRPIGEPVAWYGPIVMNTQEELRIAFEEYENGAFIRHKKV